MTPVSAEMRSLIQAKLAEIEQAEGIKVLMAIESGSRAWGFHSPDSDYDVRFIYARPMSWHLGLEKRRDVVEYPIDAVLDISGWELGKALKLSMQSNAVVAEWLQSPIVYRAEDTAVAALTDFSQTVLTRRPIMWHYVSMLKTQLDRAQRDDGTVQVKRFFYALRPALALRWIRTNDAAMAPMDMAKLMAGSDLDADISAQIEDLIALKKTLDERQTADQVPAILVKLIQDEAQIAQDYLKNTPEKGPKESHFDAANKLNIQFSKWAGD